MNGRFVRCADLDAKRSLNLLSVTQVKIPQRSNRKNGLRAALRRCRKNSGFKVV
jgi:hypothetical protein